MYCTSRKRIPPQNRSNTYTPIPLKYTLSRSLPWIITIYQEGFLKNVYGLSRHLIEGCLLNWAILTFYKKNKIRLIFKLFFKTNLLKISIFEVISQEKKIT